MPDGKYPLSLKSGIMSRHSHLFWRCKRPACALPLHLPRLALELSDHCLEGGMCMQLGNIRIRFKISPVFVASLRRLADEVQRSCFVALLQSAVCVAQLGFFL